MKKYTIWLALVALGLTGQAQVTGIRLPAFNQEKNSLNKKAFLVLGSWSAASILAGIAGQATSSGEAKYFHQMNIIWGSVNMLIALPGYLAARKNNTGQPLAATLKGQATTEKTFLFNAGLDIAYLAAGAWLLEKGNSGSHTDRYNGYGKSVLLQGAALLLFDAVLYTAHRRHGKKLYRALEGLQAGAGGIGYHLAF